MKLLDDGLEDNQASASGQGRYRAAPSSSCNRSQVTIRWQLMKVCDITKGHFSSRNCNVVLDPVRTTASWRLDVLCMSLQWGDPMGLFLGAKVSSCLRSIMDFTITSKEPMQGDQRLRGRLEELGAAWIFGGTVRMRLFIQNSLESRSTQ